LLLTVALRHCYFTRYCSDAFELWLLLHIFSWIW